MAYFKYEGKDERIMEIIIKDDPLLQKAHQNYIRFTRDDELVEIYEGRMKWQSDYKSGILAAEEKRALLEKQNVLIQLLSKKFDLSGAEADRIRGVEDAEKLDAALDEFVFAESKERVLMCLEEGNLQ